MDEKAIERKALRKAQAKKRRTRQVQNYRNKQRKMGKVVVVLTLETDNVGMFEYLAGSLGGKSKAFNAILRKLRAVSTEKLLTDEVAEQEREASLVEQNTG